MAQARWDGVPGVSFCEACTPDEMVLDNTDVFEIAVAMETLEHVPPEMVDDFLSKIAKHLNGLFFVTVPNEKGVVFLLKWLVKRLLSKDAPNYRFAELVNATFGRMELVVRDEHKGFDYKSLLRNINDQFDVIEVGGFPFGFLPASLCFGIGIVAKTNQSQSNSRRLLDKASRS
jgi:2-polyprenyl-3-methyl-5-hydroxy-6-metoxy-1,4-benzoquinol methylase